MTPLCNVAHIHGRTGWKARPFTRADLLSNLVSIGEVFSGGGSGGNLYVAVAVAVAVHEAEQNLGENHISSPRFAPPSQSPSGRRT